MKRRERLAGKIRHQIHPMGRDIALLQQELRRRIGHVGDRTPAQVFPRTYLGNHRTKMTNLRYESYRRVLAVLDELEAPELEGDEREVLRDAAEGLLLTREGEEHERDKILLDAWLVLSSLVRTGRWRYRAAEQMRRMLEACGPDRIPERVAALV
jgi:hypothetical protein